MITAMICSILIAASGFSGSYQACGGWMFPVTALLSEPDPNADYLLTQKDLEPFILHPGFGIIGCRILGCWSMPLPTDVEELVLIPVSLPSEPDGFTSIIIAFSCADGWFPVDTLLSPGDINLANLYGCWMEETETLLLYPYGTMSSSYPVSSWSRDDQWKFNLISEEVHDAAAVAYSALDSLLAEGKIQEACIWLEYILMSRMDQRANAKMAVQFFYSAVNACFRSSNMEPLEQANRACGLMNMHNWFIDVPSMGSEAFLESQFAEYINLGNLVEGLACLRNMAEDRGDSAYAAELEEALNGLGPQE